MLDCEHQSTGLILLEWQRGAAVPFVVGHIPYANYVWHIDSNHKLIRWRMVIHGAIDGYSRKILYLKCAKNNRASSVISYFSEAVSTFGIPDKVRSDKGGENVDVWRFMLQQNMQSSCVITGSSTHNERIERLCVMCLSAWAKFSIVFCMKSRMTISGSPQ